MTTPEVVRVEPGVPADAPAVFAVLVEAFRATSLPVTIYREPRAVAWLAEVLGRPTPEVLVARSPAGVIGFVHAVVSGEACHLNHVAVAARARGQGAGARLLAAFEAHGRSAGATRFSLDVYAREAITVAWYARHGYRETARRVHVRLAIPPRAAGETGWQVADDQRRAAEAAIVRVGFGRVEARRGADRLVLGLIGADVVRVLDDGGHPPDRVVADVRALFAGQRAELVLVNAPAVPSVAGVLAADEVLRMEKPA